MNITFDCLVSDFAREVARLVATEKNLGRLAEVRNGRMTKLLICGLEIASEGLACGAPITATMKKIAGLLAPLPESTGKAVFSTLKKVWNASGQPTASVDHMRAKREVIRRLHKGRISTGGWMICNACGWTTLYDQDISFNAVVKALKGDKSPSAIQAWQDATDRLLASGELTPQMLNTLIDELNAVKAKFEADELNAQEDRATLRRLDERELAEAIEEEARLKKAS